MNRNTVLFALAAVVLSVLAGCASKPEPTPTRTQAHPYALDCTISNWDDRCTAKASRNDSPSKAEIDLAVNPKDPSNIVVASKDKDPLASKRSDNGQPCVWAVLQYTRDAGRSWNTTYVGKKLAERMPGDAMYGWECITDPILAFEPDGTLHYSLQVYRMRPGGVADPTCALPTVPSPIGGVGGCETPEGGFMYQAVSHDGGATFPTFVLMHVGDETAIFHDFMRIGVNPKTGTTFTIWDQITGLTTSQVVAVAVDHASDRARAPVYFPSADSPTGLGASGILGYDDGTANGIVYAWLAGFNSGGAAYLSTSTDDGTTFTAPKQVFAWTPMDPLPKHALANGTEYDPQYRTGTLVELAIDHSTGPNKGCLYAAWGGKEQDVQGAAVGASDIYVRRSCDQGNTWTDPVLVNGLHREDGQWMPRVTVDSTGTVHVVYMTRAYDPRHNLMDAEWAYSTDGGANWTQQRVTSISFDGNLGRHQDGFPFIGDYIGIGSAGPDVWMGFPSTNTGVSEIAVAHGTR